MLVPFASAQGKKMFREALSAGNMHSYFPLADQFNTQAEPEYCGPATLVAVLNALKIDPRKQWKGIWRWYSDYNLHCTNPELLMKGVCFEEFVTLARCNGLFVQPFRPKENLNEHSLVKEQIAFLAKSQKPPIDPLHSQVIAHEHSANPYCVHTNETQVKASTYDTFRTACMACSRSNSMLLAVNLSRKFLKQTGSGHFSPVCGFHRETNSSLLLDIARYKYPSYWIGTEMLYNALIPFDCEAHKKRGFLVMSKELRTGNQSLICRGIHDPISMKTMQNHLKHLYIKKHNNGNIGDMLEAVLGEQNMNKETLDEMKVLLFTYVHDLEKRMEANSELKELNNELAQLGPLHAQIQNFINASHANPVANLLKEIYWGRIEDILSLFVLSVPLGVVEKLLSNVNMWNPYKLNNIKSRVVHNEIMLLREMLGIMGEHLNQRGFYDSRYVQSHKFNG